MRTLCLNCGRELTDEKGNRKLSGNFDSALPSMPPRKDVTYARCDECWNIAYRRSRMLLPQHITMIRRGLQQESKRLAEERRVLKGKSPAEAKLAPALYEQQLKELKERIEANDKLSTYVMKGEWS